MKFASVVLASLVLACQPTPKKETPQASKTAPSVQVPAPQKVEATPAKAEVGQAPDYDVCALPAELRELGFPTHLSSLTKKEPAPPGPDTVTIAVLPDTQYYASCRSTHLHDQVAWLKNQRRKRNIAAAIHLGDLTEHNTPAEWRFVRDALAPLHEELPVLLASGNHDYGEGGTAKTRSTLFQEYFPLAASNSKDATPTERAIIATKEPGDRENAYYQLKLPQATLGVLALEWSPTDSTVAWAKKVLAAHPADRLIFVTHAYLYYDGTRYDWASQGLEQEWNVFAYGTALKNPLLPPTEGNLLPGAAHDGQMLWEELLRDHRGAFLTLNGHVLGDGAGLLSSRTRHGNLVHQVLCNYQMLDEAGQGWLRLIEIAPKGDRLRMKTYSPTLKRYSLAPEQHFELAIDPPLW